ncbi:MAG: hypothetical protein ABI615_05840 [Chthoniobacterales bacterium]
MLKTLRHIGSIAGLSILFFLLGWGGFFLSFIGFAPGSDNPPLPYWQAVLSNIGGCLFIIYSLPLGGLIFLQEPGTSPNTTFSFLLFIFDAVIWGSLTYGAILFFRRIRRKSKPAASPTPSGAASARNSPTKAA